MKKSTRNILYLFSLVTLAPLCYADGVSPESIDGAITVDVHKAKQLFEQGISFVDVRKNKDWQAGRVPGAIHIELKNMFNEKNLSDEVNKHQAVVLYCNGPKCMRSSKASKEAVAWGFTKIYYFRDGFPAWKNAGYPVE